MNANQFALRADTATATIANGASLSGAISLYGCWPVGVVTPAAWTAADITFAVSYDNDTTYVALYSSTAEIKIATAIVATGESRYFGLDPTAFHGATHVKIRSGVNGSAVTQGADRIMTIVRAFRLA
jgi:hypothetical protein